MYGGALLHCQLLGRGVRWQAINMVWCPDRGRPIRSQSGPTVFATVGSSQCSSDEARRSQKKHWFKNVVIQQVMPMNKVHWLDTATCKSDQSHAHWHGCPGKNIKNFRAGQDSTCLKMSVDLVMPWETSAFGTVWTGTGGSFNARSCSCCEDPELNCPAATVLFFGSLGESVDGLSCLGFLGRGLGRSGRRLGGSCLGGWTGRGRGANEVWNTCRQNATSFKTSLRVHLDSYKRSVTAIHAVRSASRISERDGALRCWSRGFARAISKNFAWNLLTTRIFFCSNASIALARSLCKYLLAVLITASEADAVAGFMDLWCDH